MNHSDVPNPFTSAKRISALSVMLNFSDIIDVYPNLTATDVERLFKQKGSRIATKMIAAGVDAAIEIIEQEGAKS
ncbi:MAG TPA: hypothetical protein VGG19_02155 [Tepidisphaeraceae bacterium]|jgi:hypothetical protein